MGTIMAVVAVLLIHIERNAVVVMKPNISLRQKTGSFVMSRSRTLSYVTAKHLCQISAYVTEEHLRGHSILFMNVTKPIHQNTSRNKVLVCDEISTRLTLRPVSNAAVFSTL